MSDTCRSAFYCYRNKSIIRSLFKRCTWVHPLIFLHTFPSIHAVWVGVAYPNTPMIIQMDILTGVFTLAVSLACETAKVKKSFLYLKAKQKKLFDGKVLTPKRFNSFVKEFLEEYFEDSKHVSARRFISIFPSLSMQMNVVGQAEWYNHWRLMFHQKSQQSLSYRSSQNDIPPKHQYRLKIQYRYFPLPGLAGKP